MNRLVASLSRRSALVICSAVVAFLLPAGLSAFAIKLEHFVHQEITFDGLNPLEGTPNIAPKFELTLDTGAKVKFSVGSINEIVFHNVATDDLQGPLVTRLHFDSEDLAGGSDRLIRLREQIVFNLANAIFLDFSNPDATTERAVRVTNSRALLGRALHTLQDFYAHTNWVERNNFSLIDIDTRLGNAIVPSPPLGASCDSSEPEVAPLTSGWFLNDKLTAYCDAPENKCAHGSVGCGIHKDINLRIGFVSAEALAIKATNTYTRETLQAVLASYTRLVPQLGTAGAKQAVRLAVCEFMGVPDAFSTCLTSNTVTVQKLNKPNGQATLEGLVQSSGDAVTPAIDCGLFCEGTAIAGTEVQLTARDAGEWRFVRWAAGGACAASTARECKFLVEADTLARPEYIHVQPGALASYTLECYVMTKFNEAVPCSQLSSPDSTVQSYYAESEFAEGVTGSSAEASVELGRSLQDMRTTIHINASATGQWGAQGQIFTRTELWDVINVTSDTLSPGTAVPVEVSFSHQIDVNQFQTAYEPEYATLNGGVQASGHAQVGMQFINTTPLPSASPGSASYPYQQSLVVTAVVGLHISIDLENRASAGFLVERGELELEVTSTVLPPRIRAVNGEDVQFESQNGYVYAQP